MALLGTKNLNTSDELNKNDNVDGDRVYGPPVDENCNFLNVFDSFVDEDDNIWNKRRWFSISTFRFEFGFSLHPKRMCFVS